MLISTLRATRALCAAFALCVIALWIHPCCAQSATSPDTARQDQRIADRFQEWLLDQCARHPMFSSSLGNHDHDHELDDLSPEARARDLENDRAVLRELETQIDKSQLSRNAQIDLEIWQHTLKYRIWQAANSDDFANDPRIYLTYASDSVFTLLTQSTLPKHRNVENSAQRIAKIPQVVEAAKKSIGKPPKILTEIAIKRTEGAIAFYESDIFTLADESPHLSILKQPAISAVASLKEFKR
ncbi:MAG: DUF885 family protein, partial [Pirellula sp.]